MGEVRRHWLFVQAVAEGRGRCDILGKGHVIASASVLDGV